VPSVICGTVVLEKWEEAKDDFTNDQLVIGLVTPLDDKPQELRISDLSEFTQTVCVDKALCLPITTV